MEKKEDELKKVLWGALLGSLVGGVAFYLMKSSKSGQGTYPEKIGKALSTFGEMIEESHVDNRKEAMMEIEKELPEHTLMTSLLEWAATGIKLWKKLK